MAKFFLALHYCAGVICDDLCVCVCVFTSPPSPRHGWTGRVWSHERTIHEDRGGLPARLLGHRQRKVSDGSRHTCEPRGDALASASASVYSAQQHSASPPSHKSCSDTLTCCSSYFRTPELFALAVDIYFCFLLPPLLFSSLTR